MSENLEIKTVEIDFTEAADRKELLEYICQKQKLVLSEVKTRFKINGPMVGYEALTGMLRSLKISYSFNGETGMLTAQVPVVPAEGIKVIVNPDTIPNTSADETEGEDFPF